MGDTPMTPVLFGVLQIVASPPLWIRIRPQVVWRWSINQGVEKRFGSIERRNVS
jgi:hypothetical protein